MITRNDFNVNNNMVMRRFFVSGFTPISASKVIFWRHNQFLLIFPPMPDYLSHIMCSKLKDNWPLDTMSKISRLEELCDQPWSRAIDVLIQCFTFWANCKRSSRPYAFLSLWFSFYGLLESNVKEKATLCM